MPQLSDQQLTPEQEGLIKELFQKAYQMIYGEGKFDVLYEHAQEQGAATAVPLLVASVMDKIITQGKVTDVSVLFTISVMLVIDLVNALAESGIEATEEDIPAAIESTVSGVLANNPAFAQSIMKDPNIAGTMKHMEDQGEQAAPEQPQQGVL